MGRVSEPRRECAVSLIWFLFQPELTAAGQENAKVMRLLLFKPTCVEDLIPLPYCGLLFLLPVKVFYFLRTFLAIFLLYAVHHGLAYLLILNFLI